MQHFRKIWTEEMNDFIKKTAHFNRKEGYQLFMEKFNFPDITFTAYCNQRFRSGAILKSCPHGSTKILPLYSEHTKKGYVMIKVAQPSEWIMKGRWIFEEYNPGYEYKQGDMFIFLDGNKLNFHPSNIAVIPRTCITLFIQFGGTVNGAPELTRLHIAQAILKSKQLDVALAIGEAVMVQSTNGRAWRRMKTERKAKYSCEDQREKQRIRSKKYREKVNNSPVLKERQKAYRKEYYWAHKGEK